MRVSKDSLEWLIICAISWIEERMDGETHPEVVMEELPELLGLLRDAQIKERESRCA